MMAVMPRSAASWIASANGKYASDASTASLRPVRCLVERDLDRRQAAGLAGADAHERRVPREHDRVARDVPHRAPREQQVGQLLERRPTAGHDLQL